MIYTIIEENKIQENTRMSSSANPSLVFFLPSFEGGGAEQNLIHILKKINRAQYDITLVLGNKKGVFLDQVPGDVLVVDLKGGSLLNIFLKLKAYFASQNPDIFISTFPRFNIVTLLAKIASRTKGKFVIIEQTTPSKLYKTAKSLSHKIIAYFFLSLFIKSFYPKADVIVCVSNSVKRDLLGMLPKFSKFEVIYNPIVDDDIGNLSKESLGEDQYIFEGANPVIIAVGRLVAAKDYPNLLKAFKKVLDAKPAKLLILGEGPEEKHLKSLATDLHIDSDVIFAGFKKNPYKYMAHSSVFVLSSVREGFGNVIVQAMASGVPVVAANDNSGPGEIIDNEVNGLLVPPQNSAALAEGILKLLSRADVAKKFSEQGLERARHFTVEKSVASYERLFSELLETHE